jgi:hypothetical protein
MRIKITETQLKKIKALITEITVDDAYTKFYKDIPKDEYISIVNADPLSKPNFLSPYAKWLLKIYKNKQLKLEDLERATEYISIFNRYKESDFKNVDYAKFNSLVDMGKIIKPKIAYTEYESNKQVDLCEVIDGAKKVYEDNEWCIIIPETEYASCYYGRGTEWCTTWGELSFDERHRSKTNRFKYYDDTGQLFININKNNPEERYQFHFESDQFMDVDDNQIDILEFMDNRNHKNIRNFYNYYLKDKVKNLKFSDLEITDSGCYIVIDDWSEFEPAFKEDRDHINPAIYLNDMNDTYTDYDFDKKEIKQYYLEDIDEKNMGLIEEKLKEKGYKLEDMDDDELEDAIVDEFLSEIDSALSDAKRSADEDEAYKQITNAIKDHFGVRDIQYDNKIKLAIDCPEPITLYLLNSSNFIDGYSSLNDGDNKIDFNYPYYGFDGDINKETFNEYLYERL